MRPKALTDMLASVNQQSNYPDQIVIVDGSTNDETKEALAKKEYKNLFSKKKYPFLSRRILSLAV